jgi:hypothetical protein
MTGNPLFSDKQLQEIMMLLLGTYQPGSPRWLDADNPNHLNQNNEDSKMTITQNTSQEGNAQPNNTLTPMPIPYDLENGVIYKVKDRIYDLVPTLFIDFATLLKPANMKKQQM